jgi:predicted O-linked N-acetylglucosamine transferase (SPINDLY family)
MPAPDPRIAQALHFRVGNQPAEAERIYRHILQTTPSDAEVQFLLGSLLHQTNRSDQAIEHLRRAIALSPQRTDFRPPLLEALCAQNRTPDAIAEARAMVAAQPDSADAHHILAQLLLNTGDAAAAVPHARRALELLPSVAIVHRTLAAALAASNQPNEALAAIDRAAALDPDSVDTIVERGTLLQKLGRFDDAIAAYQAALRLAPQHIDALHNLAMCYTRQGRPSDALRCCQTVTQLAPAHAASWNTLGVSLQELNRIEEAIAAFTHAVRLQPAFAEALGNLANCKSMIGRHDQAVAAYRQSLDHRPDPGTFSNMLLAQLHVPNLTETEALQQHLEYDRRFAAPLRAKIRPHENVLSPNRQLRVGYVSPDFREHPVRYFIEPILAAHDHREFEIFCYSIGERQPDAITQRFRGYASQWHQAASLDDDGLADLIRSHRIDILIDLAGHTAENRLLVFARRPAPVQVTYLGYQATTGLAAMDYRLTDAAADPPGKSELLYREELLRLPGPFFVYGPDTSIQLDPALPADRNGHITFGAFNKLEKVHEATLSAWAAILRSVPRARLLMQARVFSDANMRRSITDFFKHRGITEDQLDLRPVTSLRQHMALLGNTDVTLDTWPFNGHTTTCHCLWMGSPTITRAGETFRSRMGPVTLHHLGLSELIARDDQEYVKIAVALAGDVERLRELRQTMRQRMLACPWMDAAGFTRALEQTYRAMWERACRNS